MKQGSENIREWSVRTYQECIKELAHAGVERMEIDLLEVVFVYCGTSAEDRVLKKDKKIYIYRPACIHDIYFLVLL